jgi:hypothetical protein
MFGGAPAGTREATAKSSAALRESNAQVFQLSDLFLWPVG